MVYKISIRPRDMFDPDTLESRELRKGLSGVWGRMKPMETEAEALPVGMPTPAPPPPRMALQRLEFDSGSFTLEKALEWSKEYGWSVNDLEFRQQWEACEAEAAAFAGGAPQVTEPPATEPPTYIERDADLFAAGEYADKKLTVTEADIQRLAGTETPVPILVEHVDTTSGGKHVWKLGEVASLAAAGSWLKGKLRLLPEANALLDRIGVKGLSVTVPRALDRVVEVSVTGSPRVAGARMFADDQVVCFAFGTGPGAVATEDSGETPEPPKEEGPMAEQATPPAASTAPPQEFYRDFEARFAASEDQRRAAERELASVRQQFNALRNNLMRKETEREIDGAIAAGKLPPVVREEAIALRLSDATVSFNDSETPAGELFAAIMDRLPRLGKRSLTGEAKVDTAHLTASERDFLATHFSDLKPEDIARHMEG